MAESSKEVLSQLIALLEPLSEQERQRTVRAALTFLGAEEVEAPKRSQPQSGAESQVDVDSGALPVKASRWLKQHELTVEDLENVFHLASDDVQIIAEVAGASAKEKTQRCYLLSGVRSLLEGGEPKFSDEHAKALCRENGCYDTANHSKYVKSLGKSVAGSKAAGFELTQPGLRAAADVIKTFVAE